MKPLFADERIGREFLTAEEVESLPVGAVVIDSDGDAWQRGRSGAWHYAGDLGSDRAPSDHLADDAGPLLLVWIPPGSELKPGLPPEFEVCPRPGHAIAVGGA